MSFYGNEAQRMEDVCIFVKKLNKFSICTSNSGELPRDHLEETVISMLLKYQHTLTRT